MHWKGPYEVTERVGVTDYQIRVGNNLRFLHVNMLNIYLVRTEKIAATAAILDPEDNPSLEVRTLLEKREESYQDVSLTSELSPVQVSQVRGLKNLEKSSPINRAVLVWWNIPSSWTLVNPFE